MERARSWKEENDGVVDPDDRQGDDDADPGAAATAMMAASNFNSR